MREAAGGAAGANALAARLVVETLRHEDCSMHPEHLGQLPIVGICMRPWSMGEGTRGGGRGWGEGLKGAPLRTELPCAPVHIKCSCSPPKGARPRPAPRARTEAIDGGLAALRELVDELYARHGLALLVFHRQGHHRPRAESRLFVVSLGGGIVRVMARAWPDMAKAWCGCLEGMSRVNSRQSLSLLYAPTLCW